MLKPASILGSRISVIAVCALLGGLTLGGCGQKGALYLPGSSKPAPAPDQAASAPTGVAR
ncbi:LPS translocon maturation chaperone LptM [Methylibium sp. Pch-M]|uniref:LPS translocon maturation chaperone LptM n=1 Tax=Methylibium sp. Pch-M TaxID=2082386 RepID=UPI0010134935|nr:lipoprotein [Methylibium sp. Pch-M]